MRLSIIAALPAALALTACVETAPEADEALTVPAELPLFGPGYRGEGDQCRRAGESAFTNQFLDDAADFVACPPGMDPGLFSFETGGREVGRLDGWILFSVPRR
jgi:hypothetical protein